MRELRQLRAEFEGATGSHLGETVDRLFDLLEKQARRIERLEKENEQLRQRLAGHEPEEDRQAAEPSPTGEDAQHYSLQAEEKRRRKQRKQSKRKTKAGRKPGQTKLEQVGRWIDIVPEGVAKEDCFLQSERPVWRLKDGRAVLVGYRIYRAAWQPTPTVPGVLSRCEYGIEVHVLLAYLVYTIGISIEKACQLLDFFCHLPIAPSQADAMLTQLGRHWSDEYDTLCDLLANAAVVYTDETGWRVGRLNSSLWSFTSDLHCLMLFGCSKDRRTLESILPPETFDGVLVSDDAAVYQRSFSRSQKCWAHLLRKIFKLALLYPENQSYCEFRDGLLELYYDARRVASDRRLSEAGRRGRIVEFEKRLCELCHPHWPPITPDLPTAKSDHEKAFRNLVNELLRLMMAEQLFVFVLDPQVNPTNNLSERQLRSSAQARKAHRTNKTDTGSRRQTHIVSVLESLRRTLSQFTIDRVVHEVTTRLHRGLSMFQPTGPPGSPNANPAPV